MAGSFQMQRRPACVLRGGKTWPLWRRSREVQSRHVILYLMIISSHNTLYSEDRKITLIEL